MRALTCELFAGGRHRATATARILHDADLNAANTFVDARTASLRAITRSPWKAGALVVDLPPLRW